MQHVDTFENYIINISHISHILIFIFPSISYLSCSHTVYAFRFNYSKFSQLDRPRARVHFVRNSSTAPLQDDHLDQPQPHDFLPQFPWQSDRDFLLSHGYNGQLVRRACIGVYRPIATTSCCRSWFMPHCLLAHGSARTVPIVRIHPSLIYPFFFLVAASPPSRHRCL